MASSRRSLLLGALAVAIVLAVALTMLNRTAEPVNGLPTPLATGVDHDAGTLSATLGDTPDRDAADQEQRSAVDVAAENPPTVIHGRMVHKDSGEPVTGCKVFVILVESSFSMPRQEVSQETWTDADGRFRLELALDPEIDWRGSIHAYSPDTEAFNFPVLFEGPRTLDMGDQKLARRSEQKPGKRDAREEMLRTLFDATRKRPPGPSRLDRLLNPR